MPSVKALYRRLKNLDSGKVIEKVMEENAEALLSANKEQMLEGKNNRGEDITPGYLEDPYFKSRESAQRYSDWKDEITPNPKRRRGTPNLYIKGPFHNSITIIATRDKVIFNTPADEIVAKFKNILGLGGDIKKDFIRHKLRPSLITGIRKEIKL